MTAGNGMVYRAKAFKLENGGEKSEKMGTNDETDDRDWRLETAGPSDPVEWTESAEGPRRREAAVSRRRDS